MIRQTVLEGNELFSDPSCLYHNIVWRAGSKTSVLHYLVGFQWWVRLGAKTLFILLKGAQGLFIHTLVGLEVQEPAVQIPSGFKSPLAAFRAWAV